jgi:hypothetical protein
VRLIAGLAVVVGLAILVLGLGDLRLNTGAQLPVGFAVGQVVLGCGLVLGNLPTALQLQQRVLVVGLTLLGLLLCTIALILFGRAI